ncbi:16369_t:CDS:2 [Funneliformis mosseae]|uniref:16369_t:CDS:1 n=1 Tax=Funneliformis mosseae TaxID=27381 RepID=A0A9N9CJ82_FUNMO|nr:16369_t:CDS:2 [Funneliformis mosseae]
MKDLFKGTYDLNEFEFLENQEGEIKLPDESFIKYQKLKHQYSHTSHNKHLSLCTVYKNYFEQKIVKDEYNKTEKTEDALDLLQSNCLVVYKANFKNFYGYMYFSQIEFFEANDKLNANIALKYELKTVKMIKEETVYEIYNKRLYDNEDDLYSKVSE